MKRLLLLGAAATVALSIAATDAPVQAREFTVVAWGGQVQATLRKLFFQPFAEKMGITVLEDTYLGGLGPFLAHKQTGNYPWDVVQVESAELHRGCEEGLFVKLDWSKIGERDKYIPEAVHECAVGWFTWAFVLGYNGDRLKEDPPTKLTDFWDLTKYPGKRALRNMPVDNLELALMADGVAPKDIYKILSTPEGIDRAFAKLDQIKDHTLWWEAGPQSAEWLISGDVDLALVPNGHAVRAIDEGKNLKMIWDGASYALDHWVIINGAEHVDLGHEFLKFYSDPQRQAEFTKHYAYGPIVKAALSLVPKNRMPLLPTPENLRTSFFRGSADAMNFWTDNLEVLTERFAGWVAK